MSERNDGYAFAPRLGIFAVFAAIVYGFVQTGKSPERKAPEQEKNATAVLETESAVPVDLEAFLKRNELSLDKQKKDGENKDGEKVASLIVTVPDPLESQFGHWHDQAVDSITQALGDCDYFLDDHWFPWIVLREDKTKNLVYRQGHPDKDPGVFVYRNKHNIHDRLCVLLVGENPLSGLRHEVAIKALDLAKNWLADPQNDKIKIVGPFFTGSQASLAHIILDWNERNSQKSKPPKKPVKFDIVSGTAMGLQPWSEIDCRHASKLQEMVEKIQVTQIPFHELLQAVFTFVNHRGESGCPGNVEADPPKERVAFVVEARSGFGDEVVSEIKNRLDTTKNGQNSQTNRFPPLLFRFPMHVARAAALLSKEQRDRDERLGLLKPGADIFQQLDQSRQGGDLVPAANEMRTALINLRLMHDYWKMIRRDRVKYVFVFATDTRDSLFLLEQMQEHCPDALPIVLGADLQYVHTDFLRFTRGVVVVGTYPLFGPAQEWTMIENDNGRRIPFPTCYAEGVYNAVLAILDSESKKKMVDYQPPRSVKTEKQKQEVKPPIWLTVIGEKGEFLPLIFFTGYDCGETMVKVDVQKESSATDSFSYGRSFGVPSLGAFVLIGFALWAVILGVNQSTTSELTAPDPTYLPGVRGLYISVIIFACLLCVVPLGLALVLPEKNAKPVWVSILGVAIAFAVILVMLALLVEQFIKAKLSRSSKSIAAPQKATGGHSAPVYTVGKQFGSPAAPEKPADGPPPSKGFPWPVILIFAIGTLSLFIFLVYQPCYASDAQALLFRERAAAAASGISPVLPAMIIGLGLIIWAKLGFSVLRLAGKFRIESPYPDWPKDRPKEIAEDSPIDCAVRNIRDAAREIDWSMCFLGWLFRYDKGGNWWERCRWSGVALLIAAIAGFFFVSERAMPTWETHAWNCLFSTAFTVLMLAIIISGYRYYLMWKMVQKITRSIMSIPMVAAFDHFPAKLSQVLSNYLFTSRQRPCDLAIAEHLRNRAVKSAQSEPQNALASAAVNALAGQGPVQLKDPTMMLGDDVKPLCESARKLVNVLAPSWAAHKASEAFGTVPRELDKEAREEASWADVAEQFIAMMAVIFVSQYLKRMSCFAWMSVVGCASLLLAITTYQFQPERIMMSVGVVFTLSVIAIIIYVHFGINRNELISRVTRTTPNRFELNWTFVQNIALLLVPLITLLINQLGGRLRSVAEPVLEIFR